MQKKTGIRAGTGLGVDERDDMICALTTLSDSFSALLLIIRMQSARSTESNDIIGAWGPGSYVFAISHKANTSCKRLEENGWCPFTLEAEHVSEEVEKGSGTHQVPTRFRMGIRKGRDAPQAQVPGTSAEVKLLEVWHLAGELGKE